MTLVRANGVTLHVQELVPTGVAEPPTAVLLHGLATDSMASWYFTMAYPLVELGYRVLLLDLRGHGRSERPTIGYALDDFVDDLSALLEKERKVLLLGNSFGGTVAFAYAARHPSRVSALVSVESSPPTTAWFARLTNRIGELAAAVSRPRALVTVGARRGALGAQRAQDAARLLAETSVREELPASRLPSRDRLAAITCPVLCLYGERSHVVEMAPETQRLLPQAALRVFAGQKHTLLIDQPEDVRAAITAWLRTSQPGG
ncbi:pimeloyl-ACP methyl ester carboxylesterase [Actinoplanes tereljensis]|uniref:Alpha/beta hydrolase n=1 Tax=Paractinoplanes tereljensis TaxID=571912 RepID=A0A919NYU1_9ACTN|nr:alpha/beta hydrolase [Actinoplanes tereljensis]GIF26162.1 alpha/beta hydrolase [Actinoplanes tereljensis]